MSSANLYPSNQLELAQPIHLVAWHIAEQFEKMPAEVFARSIELDNPKKNESAQQNSRWWDNEIIRTTYEVGIAAHVAENLKWWSLSQDEKNIARELEKKGQSNVAAQKIFRRAFPFHKAFLDGGSKSGLPSRDGKITDLGDVIAGDLYRIEGEDRDYCINEEGEIVRKSSGKQMSRVNEALIVAYLEGLAALPYTSKTCARRLGELAENAADAAEAYYKAKCTRSKWSSVRIEAAKEVRHLLPLE